MNALQYCCSAGYLSKAKKLVSIAQFDCQVQDQDGWTPLHYACLRRNFETAWWLVVEREVDYSLPKWNDQTALEICFKQKDIRIQVTLAWEDGKEKQKYKNRLLKEQKQLQSLLKALLSEKRSRVETRLRLQNFDTHNQTQLESEIGQNGKADYPFQSNNFEEAGTSISRNGHSHSEEQQSDGRNSQMFSMFRAPFDSFLSSTMFDCGNSVQPAEEVPDQ